MGGEGVGSALGPVKPVRLMDGREVNEEQNAALPCLLERVHGLSDLVFGRFTAGDTEIGPPMGFGEEAGKDARQFILPIEEAGTSDTDRMVVPRGEGLRERGFLEGESGVHGADAAGELGGKEARVWAGSERG